MLKNIENVSQKYEHWEEAYAQNKRRRGVTIFKITKVDFLAVEHELEQ